MKLFRIISIVIVAMILLQSTEITVLASKSDELADPKTGFVDSPVQEEREDTGLDKRQPAIPAAITKPVDEEYVTGRVEGGVLIHEESFKSDSFLKGTSGKMETTFSVGEWKVNEVQLTLVYSASQFIDHTKSSFTVLLNGVRCVTESQPSTYGERGQIKLTLPASELKLGSNTLAIEADILTMGTEPETAGSIESGWFNVFKDSTISIAYEPLNEVHSIQEFYHKFISIESMDFKKSTVAIPKQASNEELENAMYAISGISKNTPLYFQNIGFETADILTDLTSYNNIIYIASYMHLPSQLSALLSDKQKKQAEQEALITVVNVQEQNILIVTGANEASLANASRLLANKEMMQQMTETDRVVSVNEKYELEPKPFEQYRMLTESGTLLEGEAVQSMNYYVEFPYNRSITDKSQLYLVFRYGDNLDFARSLMTVYLNEIPVASKCLNESSAARDEVTFNIPADIAVAGNFVLRVAFDLRVKDGGGAAPWAFISPESTLKINFSSQSFFVFENYPSPFIQDGTFNDVLVVLPQNLADADLNVLGETFNLFGQYLESVAGELTVVRDTEKFDINNKNVITIGVQNTNAYTQSLNKEMFFQFSPDGKRILSNEKMMLDSNFSRNMGTIQLLESPASQDHAILVMTGTSENGLLKAASYLKTPDYAWKVFGDGFVTDMQEIYNFRFKEANVQKLSIPSKFKMRTDLTTLSIVLSVLGLMIILSFIFLMMKYRKGGKSQ